MIAELLYVIFTFFITILVAYILGITIVNVVDRRLEKISIKLPEKWNGENETPREYWKGREGIEGINGNDDWNITNGNIEKQNEKEYENIMNVARKLKDDRIKEDKINASITNNAVLIQNASGFENTTVEHFSDRIDKIVDKKCSLDIGDNKIEPTKNNMYPSEPINYPHPQTMARVDLNVYKAKYHPRMTRQDYTNWLELFQSGDDMKKLKKMGETHYDNLQKLLKRKAEDKANGKETFEFDICKDGDDITPPPYVPTKLVDKGGGNMYPHYACPFMSYDIKNLLGYNFRNYSEFR